jgi:hypothetical protein
MSSLEKEIIHGIEYQVYRDIQNNIPYESYIRKMNFWDFPYFKMIICNEDGSPRYKKFFKNGYLHCDFGPAILWYKNNEVIGVKYCIEGKDLTEEEFNKRKDG